MADMYQSSALEIERLERQLEVKITFINPS